MEQPSRRLFLQVAAAGALTAGLPKALQADTRGKILPLVIFFQGGAQSPYEFVSPLLDAPKEMRGDATTIRAKNGERIDSRWPKFAQVADQTAVIRSLDAGNVQHNATFTVAQPSVHADALSSGGIPHPFIEAPSNFSDRSQLMIDSAMHIQWNKDENRFAPPPLEVQTGLERKLELLKTLEQPLEGKAVERMQRNRDLAANLLLGGGKAIDEPFAKAQKNKKRYGDNPVGEACALASNFAQSGAGVTLVYNELGRGWDLHSRMKEGYEAIIPPTDQALEQLILDSRRHGFVLLMTTDHGRDPRLNGGGGREHYPVSYAVMAGGSTNEGAVIGRTDKRGEIASEKIVGPKLIRTALQACGVEHPNRFELVAQALK